MAAMHLLEKYRKLKQPLQLLNKQFSAKKNFVAFL